MIDTKTIFGDKITVDLIDRLLGDRWCQSVTVTGRIVTEKEVLIAVDIAIRPPTSPKRFDRENSGLMYLRFESEGIQPNFVQGKPEPPHTY